MGPAASLILIKLWYTVLILISVKVLSNVFIF